MRVHSPSASFGNASLRVCRNCRSTWASVGATLAPLLVVGLATNYGWRSAFIATGALGLVFAVLWRAVGTIDHYPLYLLSGLAVWVLLGSSLNNADAWVLGIGVMSCLGLVTGVLG